MTKTKRTFILALSLATLLTLGHAERAGTEEEIIPTDKPKVYIKQTDEREEWLSKLIMCESSGRPEAINEIDLDGTPSYGLLQFKPSTFELFSKAYGIEGELMDPEAQKAIVRRMMDDPSIKWEKQFPACVRRLGNPPAKLSIEA